MREGGIGGDGIDHLLFALRVIELPTGTKLRGRNRICRLQAPRGGIDERCSGLVTSAPAYGAPSMANPEATITGIVTVLAVMKHPFQGVVNSVD